MDKDEAIRDRWPMKARPFLSAVGAVLLSLVLIAAGLLWTMDRHSPLRLAETPLQLPRAARFVPRDADLSLHWLADPARLPSYAQAVAPAADRRSARDGARQWREGGFRPLPRSAASSRAEAALVESMKARLNASGAAVAAWRSRAPATLKTLPTASWTLAPARRGVSFHASSDSCAAESATSPELRAILASRRWRSRPVSSCS